jgi:hypothetical protein
MLGKLTGRFLRKKFMSFAERSTLSVLRELTSNERLIGVLTGGAGDVPTAKLMAKQARLQGLIVGSRVLFGHSGSVERFANRSWTARLIVAAVVLAALTRISADFLPRVAISHFEYAAWTWVAAAGAWTVWHARRFFGKDPTE